MFKHIFIILLVNFHLLADIGVEPSKSKTQLKLNQSPLLVRLINTEKIHFYHQSSISLQIFTGSNISWDLTSGEGIKTSLSTDLPKGIQYFNHDGNIAFLTVKHKTYLNDFVSNNLLVTLKNSRLDGTSPMQAKLLNDKIITTGNINRNIEMIDIKNQKIDYTISINPIFEKIYEGSCLPQHIASTYFELSHDNKEIIVLSPISYYNIDENMYGFFPNEGKISIYNLSNGTLKYTIPTNATKFFLIPHSKIIIMSDVHGEIHFWDTEANQHISTQQEHNSAIYKLDMLNNTRFISYDVNKNTILWDIKQRKPIKKWNNTAYMNMVSQSGHYLLELDAISYTGKNIRLLDIDKLKYIFTLEYPITSKIQTSFVNNDKLLLISTPSANATKVFQTSSGKELATLQAYDNGEWIIMTPQGYFNTSPKGRDFITDLSGNPIDDATYKQYFNPEKVKELLNPKESR